MFIYRLSHSKRPMKDINQVRGCNTSMICVAQPKLWLRMWQIHKPDEKVQFL